MESKADAGDMATFTALNVPNDPFAEVRRWMVESQIRRRGISDERVLRAMSAVPRHEFVLPSFIEQAYNDEPLPIGHGQTISQPYIVAAMVAGLRLSGSEHVLEIGAGCGYQAAALSLLAKEVYTVELLPELARTATERLHRLGYINVHVRCGDGSLGWPECGPYEAILIAAAAPRVPQPLPEQLAEGGRLIAPIGHDYEQELQLLTKREGKYAVERGGQCRFVPLVGRYGSLR